MTDGGLRLGVVTALLLAGCDLAPGEDGGATGTPETTVRVHETTRIPKVHAPVSQLAPRRIPVQVKRAAATAGGDEEESAEPAASAREDRGAVGLEPEVWDPNAFIRNRRRMTVRQLDRAIRKATGGIGWDDPDNNYGSMWNGVSPTLGEPDYYRQVKRDLTPGMTFQKFLGDGVNSVCAQLINWEQGLPADQRVFLVHIAPGDDPVAQPAQTDANIRMLLLRFHGKHYQDDHPAMVPWRWLVTSTALVTSDWWQAWAAMCVALMKHPNFYTF